MCVGKTKNHNYTLLRRCAAVKPEKGEFLGKR